MADKSFEQRVQEELGSLKMRPDEAVWTNVEAGLHKEKKRRWLLWLFLFAALSGGAFWMFMERGNNTGEQIANEQKAVRQDKNPPSTKEQPATTPLTNKENIAAGKLESGKEDEPVESTSEIKTNSQSSKKIIEAGSKISAVREKRQVASITKNKPGITEKSKTAETLTNVSQTTKENADKQGNVAAVNLTKEKNNTEKSETSTSIASASTASAKKESDEQQTIQPETKETATVADEIKSQPSITDSNSLAKNTSPKKQTTNKWKFGIAVDAGRSALGQGLSSSLSVGALYNAAPPPTSSGVIGSGAIANNPPAVSDAFGFGVRVEADKILNKTFSLSLFAGYTLFQTSTNIGRRVDSSAMLVGQSGMFSSAYYYRNSDSAQYTNRYNYMSLGAELYTSFTLFRKVSARWKFGTGLSFLVASNGLEYDYSSGRLYQNNALFTRVQPFLSTGVDFAIGKKQWMYIGPHLQYNAGHLNKRSQSGDHLFFTSLQFSVMLPAKKK